MSNETVFKESGCLDGGLSDDYMVYVVRSGLGSQCHKISRVRALRKGNVSQLQHDLVKMEWEIGCEDIDERWRYWK